MKCIKITFRIISIILIISLCSSCNNIKSEIEKVEIHYLPFDLTTQYPINCEIMRDNWNFQVKKIIIVDQVFLNKLENEYFNLVQENNDLTIDARIKLNIHFRNKKIDTLCLGAYFGVMKNGVKQNDNREIIKMIKKEIISSVPN